MLEKNPMISFNVRIWKYFSVILDRNWRVYGFVAYVSIMNAMQFTYLFRVRDDLVQFISNTFLAVAIFDALLRNCLVIKNRSKFETFMHKFHEMYTEIETGDDAFAKEVLKDVTRTARNISIFNLSASFFDTIGALFAPLFTGEKLHPFGVALPGVDMTKFPVYEIFYIAELPTPFLLTAVYMPFVNLFASFAMFGKALVIILQHKLRNLCQDNLRNDGERFEYLRECIKQYMIIERYIENFNSLVSYIIAVEFLLFSAIISSLLFSITLMESFTYIVMVILYISTILYVLFTYYWQANELLIESLKLSQAAYDMEWYECSPRFRKTLLLFIQRCQVPLKLMVGNIYPMSLETFQSLLNASYSYFTLLRGVNKN